MSRQAYALAVQGAFAGPERERDLALRRAGALLWRAEAWEDAAAHFAAMGDGAAARLGLAASLYHQGRLVPAEALLRGRDDAEALYLAAFIDLRQRQTTTAVESFRRLPADSPLRPAADAAARRVESWGRIPRRSPALAGTLSALLPGLGQASLGRWGEAASALLVNGLLIGGTVELARREAWAGAGLLLFFDLGFYGGNVMSAVNGARRFNRRALEARVDPLQAELGLQLLPADEGWQGTVARPPSDPASPR